MQRWGPIEQQNWSVSQKDGLQVPLQRNTDSREGAHDQLCLSLLKKFVPPAVPFFGQYLGRNSQALLLPNLPPIQDHSFWFQS